MANLFKGLFGGTKQSSTPIPSADDFADFSDYAGVPDPSPASIYASPATSTISQAAAPTSFAARPYTKWYRVWERTSLADFTQELYIIPFILVLVLIHTWGTRANRRKAKAWITAHQPILKQEFASVGFGGRRAPSVDDVQSEGLLKAMSSDSLTIPEKLLKEKSASEFVTYATGRQNVAFVDIKLSLLKRYNPFIRFGEATFGFFFESLPAPTEKMEATLYAFDGKEKELVPVPGGKLGREVVEERRLPSNSTYDGFVWAVAHKEAMRRLRDNRYDISLTSTKDHPNLPAWATVMSESAEITEALLTPELIKAVAEAGDDFEALIISDQPVDQPKKLDEVVPKKRITLTLHLPSSSSSTAYRNTLPIFHYFLRLPDQLVSSARFRPEVLRKVRQTREEEIRKIKRLDEGEKAEERKLQGDKKKKEERDRLLKGMSAEEQRKYLDKEREKDLRRSQKKKTMRG